VDELSINTTEGVAVDEEIIMGIIKRISTLPAGEGGSFEGEEEGTEGGGEATREGGRKNENGKDPKGDLAGGDVFEGGAG